LSQRGSRRLAGIHHRRATHPEPRKLGFPTRVTWQLGVYRQAVPLHGPRNRQNKYVPPGGYEQPARRFLENFQKLRFFNAIVMATHIHIINHTIMHKN